MQVCYTSILCDTEVYSTIEPTTEVVSMVPNSFSTLPQHQCLLLPFYVHEYLMFSSHLQVRKCSIWFSVATLMLLG